MRSKSSSNSFRPI